jgi:hypothetical protein
MDDEAHRGSNDAHGRNKVRPYILCKGYGLVYNRTNFLEKERLHGKW